MKRKHNSHSTIDFVALCLARKCIIYPILYDQFLAELEREARIGKLSLVPISIFQVYNKKCEKYRLKRCLWG